MIGTKYEWLFYVILAGLSWGTYVPLIFYGGSELQGQTRGMGGRLMAILCVGLAYFVIAVILPMYMFLSKQAEWPNMKTTGLVFSGMAGVAGAVGALCVIFASRSAVMAANQAQLDPATFRIYIAPLIFGLAPVINTLVSTLWHPDGDKWYIFRPEMPGWKLWLGIVLVGLGAALVLFSKEESEVKKHQAEKKMSPSPAVASHANPPPTSGN